MTWEKDSGLFQSSQCILFQEQGREQRSSCILLRSCHVCSYEKLSYVLNTVTRVDKTLQGMMSVVTQFNGDIGAVTCDEL